MNIVFLAFFMSFISFTNVSYFSGYKSCTHFVNFAPEYFSCISSFKWYNIFSFSIHVFIAVYRNTIDVFKFILHAAFPAARIYSKNLFFLAIFFGIFCVDKHVICKNKFLFLFFFPSCIGQNL